MHCRHARLWTLLAGCFARDVCSLRYRIVRRLVSVTHADYATDASATCGVNLPPWRTSHPFCGGPLLSANDRTAGVKARRVRVAIQRDAVEEQRAALARLDGNPFLGAGRKVCEASRAQRDSAAGCFSCQNGHAAVRLRDRWAERRAAATHPRLRSRHPWRRGRQSRHLPRHQT